MARNKILEYRDECVQCGESKGAIKHSQSIKDPIHCVIMDAMGEADFEYNRHRFVWTEGDEADIESRNRHYEKMSEWFKQQEELEKAGQEESPAP